MCKPKSQGGQRCAAHLRQEMGKAMEAARVEPSKENLAAMKATMGAYNRTPTGIKELRAKGDAASLALANRYDAERKEKRAVRRNAKAIIDRENEDSALYYALRLSGDEQAHKNSEGEYEQDAFEFERLDIIGIGADGRAQIVFTYNELLNREGRYELYDSGTAELSDYTDLETLDADFERHADAARQSHNPLVDIRPAMEEALSAQDEALREHFGEDYAKYVQVENRVNRRASAHDIQDYYETWLDDQEPDFLEEEDLKLLSTHPLATEEKRQEARDELERRCP